MTDVLPTPIDLMRTRVTLARLRGEAERLAAALQEAGLTEFVDRSEWLMDHWSRDERLAWRRKWRRLGLTDPAPHRERYVRSSLRQPKARRVSRIVIAPDRQLEIALRALDNRRNA